MLPKPAISLTISGLCSRGNRASKSTHPRSQLRPTVRQTHAASLAHGDIDSSRKGLVDRISAGLGDIRKCGPCAPHFDRGLEAYPWIVGEAGCIEAIERPPRLKGRKRYAH